MIRAFRGSEGGNKSNLIPVIGYFSGRVNRSCRYRSCDLKKSSPASNTASKIPPFRVPTKNSLVDIECVDANNAALFHAMLSITILKVLSCLGFFQPRYRYQFSP